MDDNRFDALAKFVGEPATRRWAVRSLGGGTFGAMLGLLGLTETEAGKKKKKKKKNKKTCPGSRKCGKKCCGKGQFCCDAARKVCCGNGADCCNPGSGTGSCCPAPNQCGKPWGNDAAPYECCPPERQWFTTTGLMRCCPTGTRSLGTGITSDDGPCCPEAKYCPHTHGGRGTCCGDVAPVCVDPNFGICCTTAQACGTACCDTPGWTVCCPDGFNDQMPRAYCCPTGSACVNNATGCE